MTDPEKKPTEWEFEPRDFDTGYNGKNERAAAYANMRLREERAKAPVVYGSGFKSMEHNEIVWHYSSHKEEMPMRPTHRARIFGIEKL